jgi:polyisoprenoid-binding protein YceI
MAWTIDTAHSEVNFAVRHMMISNVRGRFEKFSGSVNFNTAEPEKSSVEVKIEAASINTKEPNRDGHLRSADFFDAEKYPYLTFASTRVVKESENTGKVYGNLTIKDITRPVILNVEYSGMAKSPWGTYSAGFTATTKINRKEWGLTWNKSLETGGMLVGDEITINIELEIVQQPEAEKKAELEAEQETVAK